MSPSTVKLIIKVIDLVAMGIAMAPEIRAKYEETTAKLQELADEGRDPTPTEWAELDSRLNDALDELQARADDAQQ